MPEYLAPGVYVEETSFRSKSIEGVSTTTTGFVGPTRYGPVDADPEVLTSLGDFERTYGDRRQLEFGDARPRHNFMWHAARAFFEQGGRRLYVQRVFHPREESDGHAEARLPAEAEAETAMLRVRARFPGTAGERAVRLTLRRGQNALSAVGDEPTVNGLANNDIVWIGVPGSPPGAGVGACHRAASYLRDDGRLGWRFHPMGSPPDGPVELTDLDPDPDDGTARDEVRIVSLAVTVLPADAGEVEEVWDELGLHPVVDPTARLTGIRDSAFALFAPRPPNRLLARTLPIVLRAADGLRDGLDVLAEMFAAAPGLEADLGDPDSTDADRSLDLHLGNGDDGNRPLASDYEGSATDIEDKSGLKAFEDIEDLSIVAAPGSTFGYEQDFRRDADTIINHLIGHAERMRYRIAVLDAGDGQSLAAVRAMRAKFDSSHAALYYPWVQVLDPVTQREIALPPSGFVAGIYARNDVNRAVYKAPANEVVTGAIGFERLLNRGQQEVLNPEGINCFRFFEGRGFRLWGARTISSDPEWKYVNLRRYFAFLQRSIDRGTQWAVFEPNGEALWANVRRTIEDFLLDQWQSGALLGDKPERAYFVRCDRSTMTQNDLDNGRLVCLIGVAPLRPAEFVIFRIGQWTADRRS